MYDFKQLLSPIVSINWQKLTVLLMAFIQSLKCRYIMRNTSNKNNKNLVNAKVHTLSELRNFKQIEVVAFQNLKIVT